MALSVVSLYRDVLPRTNCRDCGFSTCMAFAASVVADQHPLSGCPHLSRETVERLAPELAAQYADHRWTRRDMQQDALVYARERAAKTGLTDLPGRLGAEPMTLPDGSAAVRLPFWDKAVLITEKGMTAEDGSELPRLSATFLYNHLAQGGSRPPTGKWIGFESIKNTVSKQKSMQAHVVSPLVKRFSGRVGLLKERALKAGGVEAAGEGPTADLSFLFRPLPRVPLLLLFWDAAPEDGMEAEAKVLLDETITEHLDIESMLFLCENLVERLSAGD